MSNIPDFFLNILVIIIIGQLFTYNRAKRDHEKYMRDLAEDTNKRVKVKARVTDPFKVANSHQTQKSSSKHIIIRKTPDQIRSENYQKIKEEGMTYGSPE